jgi:hypothetical protein
MNRITNVKTIEKYDAVEFQNAINETQKFFPSFATQTHVFYDQKDECVKFIAVLYYYVENK